MIRKLAHPVALSVAGLALLAAAAWMWHPIAGLAASGIALLLLEFRIDRRTP